MRFIDNLVEDRMRIIVEDKDPIHIYELLEKHMRVSLSTLKSMYDIKLNIVRKRIFIKGDISDMFDVFDYLCRRGLKFESITQTELRIDLDLFIQIIY